VKLHTRLLVALILGGIVGALLHPYASSPWVAATTANLLRPLGQVFLRSIFMIVVPMVFSALVIGVYELRKGPGLSGVAARTLGFTALLSAASVVIGLILVNAVRPGEGLQLDALLGAGSSVEQLRANAEATRPLADILVELIPRNPLDSAVRALDGEMLALMVFALAFGAALRHREAGGAGRAGEAGGEEYRNAFVRLMDEVFDACMRIIHVVMLFAPVAVFAIVANTAITFGTGVFASLGLYVVTVTAGLVIQQFVTYSLFLHLIARRSPLEFFAACRAVYLYAFSTASSNATLPLALDVAETKLRLPPQISRFVLTVGSTANQNGTALFEGVTVVFLAQAYGLDLSAGEQIRVMLMSIVAGIGTAGVPGGSLPMVLIVAQSVGVPPEGMGLILGVDRFLDMCRTTVNVSGDLVIAALVGGRQSTASATDPVNPLTTNH
jgi:DAACS family dicarboxylate/amino acid:cation (Na+ or H+) symporter